MTACQARPDRYGTLRCVACRVSWDRDDVAACPRQAPPEPPEPPREVPLRCDMTKNWKGHRDGPIPRDVQFVSALAPENIASNNR
jgi:hypothetical protein